MAKEWWIRDRGIILYKSDNIFVGQQQSELFIRFFAKYNPMMVLCNDLICNILNMSNKTIVHLILILSRKRKMNVVQERYSWYNHISQYYYQVQRKRNDITFWDIQGNMIRWIPLTYVRERESSLKRQLDASIMIVTIINHRSIKDVRVNYQQCK